MTPTPAILVGAPAPAGPTMAEMEAAALIRARPYLVMLETAREAGRLETVLAAARGLEHEVAEIGLQAAAAAFRQACGWARIDVPADGVLPAVSA